jgi:hypothetical protein
MAHLTFPMLYSLKTKLFIYVHHLKKNHTPPIVFPIPVIEIKLSSFSTPPTL